MGVAVLGTATLLAAAACGAAPNGNPSAPALQRLGSASLPAGGKGISKSLPPSWEVTMQVWFPNDHSTLRMELGSAAVMVFDGSHIWHRVKLTTQGLVVDGRHSRSASLKASSVTFRATHGPVEIRDLVIARTKR